MKITHLHVITLLAAAMVLLGATSCSNMEANNTKSLLSAAGFHVRTPQTSQQKEIYNMLPDRSVQRATVNGKVWYVFKDQEAGVAYVGREPEYQRYSQLCIQQQIAQQYYMAAQMNTVYARGWYGAWGPRYGWY